MDATSFGGQIRESALAIASLEAQAGRLEKMAAMLVEALKGGAKVLAIGNGGSAAEAMHMAEELIGRFRHNRVPLPAVALCADGTAVTCIANDFGYEQVFSRQVEALGRAGDVLVVFSTSGQSANLKAAADCARRRQMRVLCLLGKDGGQLRGAGDVELIVESSRTERIQEAHQVAMHLLLDAVEKAFPA
jgi:D-sedoheptulose 7-phosphate isomerase